MPDHRSIETARLEIKRALGDAGIESPGLDAALLIECVTGFGRAEQIAQSNAAISQTAYERLEALLQRRLSGEPIDNILGHREFYGLSFKISPDVLSPRPETEMLVDFVLENTGASEACRILDLGTGSGAIPIALLKNRARLEAAAVDISDKALLIAKENANTHGVADRLELLRGNWFEPVTGMFDYIISNPPYIVAGALAGLSPEVQGFDPALALDGGEDGLKAYREIAKGAGEHLKHGGYLVLEIGYDQGQSVPDILKSGGFTDIHLSQDLSGQDRMVTARLKS